MKNPRQYHHQLKMCVENRTIYLCSHVKINPAACATMAGYMAERPTLTINNCPLKVRDVAWDEEVCLQCFAREIAEAKFVVKRKKQKSSEEKKDCNVM